MKPKTLLRWLLVAAVFAALYLFSLRRSTPPPASWIEIAPDAAQEVEIRLPDGRRADILKGSDGAWSRKTDTGLAPTDSAAMGEFFSMIKALTSAEIVSESPEKYSKFSLDTAAMEIRIIPREGAGAPVVIRAGKSAPDGASTYMRRGDEKEVWAVRGFDEWRVRKLAD